MVVIKDVLMCVRSDHISQVSVDTLLHQLYQEWMCLSSADSGVSGCFSMGSSLPLVPGESVTVPDHLLQTCGLRPVIFKGKISKCFCVFSACSVYVQWFVPVLSTVCCEQCPDSGSRLFILGQLISYTVFFCFCFFFL